MSLSDNLKLSTELDAINALLRTIGEAPINSLNNTALPDVATARATLRDVSRAVQTRGWHWNREDEFPLAPNTDNRIVIPANMLKIRVDSLRYPDKRLVHRGTRLYDKQNHTYTFTETIFATVVFWLPFEELNQPAREFITIEGAHRFQKATVGSETLFGFTAEDKANAWTTLIEEEAEAADYNILYGSTDAPVQTYDVFQIFKH